MLFATIAISDVAILVLIISSSSFDFLLILCLSGANFQEKATRSIGQVETVACGVGRSIEVATGMSSIPQTLGGQSLRSGKLADSCVILQHI